MVLTALVVVEIAVVVPVVLTQRALDVNTSVSRLNELSDDFAKRVSGVMDTFIYNVLRTSSATVIASGFVTQEDFHNSLQVEADPLASPAQVFIWVPRVLYAEKDAYEQFYGFPLVQFNGTGTSFVPVQPREVYFPYTLFEPPSPSFRYLYGFDFLSNPRSAAYLTNESMHVVSHSAINKTSPNSYGVGIVSQDDTRKGYVVGLASFEELLGSSLVINRADVVLAAYDASVVNALQLLFLDNSTLLGNASTVAEFDALPARSDFFVRKIAVLNDTFVICMRYSDQLASFYVGSVWLVLVAVLVPVCFCVDVVFIFVALLWQNRLNAEKEEKAKREMTQMMLGYVNHEIRNPLQTILGLADLCLECLEEKSRYASSFETIIRAAEFIEHIARDILDVQRIEEGKITLEVADLNVDTLLSGLGNSVQPLSKSGVEFKVVRDPGLVELRTDRYRLEQIVMNFLTNAFKHTERGVITLEVALKNLETARISVADTGKGIPDEMKNRMFGQFGQVEAKDASELGGFGLGLFLSKILATLLGGSVGFSSQVGVGSTFWVELPVAVVI